MTDDIEKDPATPAEPGVAEDKAAEYLAGWQRARADYENLLKEVARERSEMAAYATGRALGSILPVYDHLRTALVNVPTSEDNQVKTWIDGVGHIRNEFAEMLKRLGIEEVAVEGVFDPKWHEAAGEEAADGRVSGTILRVIEHGYRQGTRLLKPARVIIVK